MPDAMPASVKRALADVVVDPGPDGPEINDWWGARGLTQAEKVFSWNTFEVLAMVSGNPERPVSAVPPRAKAHRQIRFTVDKDPDTFLPALQKFLDEKDEHVLDFIIQEGLQIMTGIFWDMGEAPPPRA